MHYSAYYPSDMVNGPGIRAVLFTSGCLHGCVGCYNKTTWNPRTGKVFDIIAEDKIIRDLNDTRVNRQGLTLSGGDPLHQANLSSIYSLVRRVRRECPGKDIWLWTGYTIEQLLEGEQPGDDLRRAIIKHVDVVVDGKFVQELHDPSLKFRGSSNQKIVNMKEYVDYDNNGLPTLRRDDHQEA